MATTYNNDHKKSFRLGEGLFKKIMKHSKNFNGSFGASCRDLIERGLNSLKK